MSINVRCTVIALILSILAVTCPLQIPVSAQEKNQYFLVAPPLSLGPGQSSRFTLFVPDGIPIRTKATLLNERNGLILESPVASIPANLPFTWTFTHSQVAAGTGIAGINNYRLLVSSDSSRKIEAFVISIQTINQSTGDLTDGTSQTLLTGEKAPSTSDTDQTPGTMTQNYMAGVIPGQPLTISTLNPAAPKTFGQPVTFTATISNPSGSVIATSPTITIPANEFRTVTFDTTSWTPDPLTGRASVRVNTVVTGGSGRDPLNIKRFFVVDQVTLNTMWEAGDECLVFYLGGIP